MRHFTSPSPHKLSALNMQTKACTLPFNKELPSLLLLTKPPKPTGGLYKKKSRFSHAEQAVDDFKKMHV